MVNSYPRYIEASILHVARCSPELLPLCMVSLQFRCEGCSIGDQDSCLLLQEPDFLSLMRWKVLNLWKPADNEMADDLGMALVEVFESQGSAMHVDKILGLLQRQNPQLTVNLAQLKGMLKSNPEFFKETDANVFTMNSDAGEA